MDKINKVAAIDIGSNAVRLLISNVKKEDGSLSVHKSSLVRVPIRLGQDVFTQNKISNINYDRLVKAMKAFSLLMEVNNTSEYKAYATSAMRNSENGKEIIKDVLEDSGIQIEIIDGKKEADILFNSGLKKFINPEHDYLTIDVGGGSTELSIYQNRERKYSKSFKIGTVRLLNNLVREDQWKEMKCWIKKKTENQKKQLITIGTGGNINKMSKLLRRKDFSFGYYELNNLHSELKKLTYQERMKQFELNPDRADVIVPAGKIYLSAMRWANSNQIIVPKIGLSDGMVWSIARKKYL